MIVDTCMPLNASRMQPEVWGGRVRLQAASGSEGMYVRNNLGYRGRSGEVLRWMGNMEPNAVYLVDSWSQSFSLFEVAGTGVMTGQTAVSSEEYAARSAWIDSDDSFPSYPVQPVGVTAVVSVAGLPSFVLGSNVYGPHACRFWIANPSASSVPVRFTASGGLAPDSLFSSGSSIRDGWWTLRLGVFRVTDPALIEEYYRRNA